MFASEREVIRNVCAGEREGKRDVLPTRNRGRERMKYILPERRKSRNERCLHRESGGRGYGRCLRRRERDRE